MKWLEPIYKFGGCCFAVGTLVWVFIIFFAALQAPM